MIKQLTLTTSDKKEIKVLLPTDWGYLTCEQYIAISMLKYNQIPEILEVLTGIDIEILKQIKASDIELIEKEISFIYTDFKYENIEVKSTVEIYGNHIKIPQKIELETWGQKLFIKEKIKENKTTSKVFPIVAAVYLCDKPFTEQSFEIMYQRILKSYIVDIFPIASFFLFNSLAGWRLKRRNYNQTLRQKNFRQALRASVNLAILQL